MNNTHFDKEELYRISSSTDHILRKIKKRIPRKKYKLTQSSFNDGTLRITKPGTYVLKENITFAPNPSNDFRPFKGDKKYYGRAFSLGFFAAISIEVDGVEIDLNEKTLKQSNEMAWMQRFYANIETASTAFIPGQGPGDFGKSIISPKYIYIHNGTLGRSSHHGIHGNGNEYVYVENVRMVDYEFIGSAINGGKYIVHRDCVIDHNFKDLKVLATWSAAIFTLQFSDEISTKMSKVSDMNRFLFEDLQKNRLRLQNSIQQTRKELFSGKTPTNSLYRNDKKIADGNVYGILSNPIGVAINKFASKENMGDKEGASYFYVENCEIKDLEGDVDEVISLVNSEGKAQKGLSGDLLKLKDCTTITNAYKGNVISDMIMSLAKVKSKYPHLGYGTLNIDKDVIDWSEGKVSFDYLTRKGYNVITGQDSMGHTNKGVLGIRIDGTKHVVLSHNSINNIVNHARLGATYNKKTDEAYLGTITSGIHLSYATDVWVTKTLIKNIRSYNGEASGIKGIHSSSFNIVRSSVRNISSGLTYVDGEWLGRNHKHQHKLYCSIFPNSFPSSKGLCWSVDSKSKYEELEVQKLKGPQVFYIAVVP